MSLYDPGEFPSEVPTQKIDAAPSLDFTVADVLAWARTKPADEAYNYCDENNCAIAQFGKATKRPHLIDVTDPSSAFPFLRDALYGGPLCFGALVKRLEALRS